MRRTPYKAAFCGLVLALASACAGAPRPDPVAIAAAQSECEALAVKYAHTVRDAGEATARYGSAHPRRTELESVKAALRREMAQSGSPNVSLVAAAALGAELADAKAIRASLSARYGERHPRVLTADAGIAALQSAIAAERSSTARAS